MQAEEQAADMDAREDEAPVGGEEVTIVARMEHPVELEQEVRSASNICPSAHSQCVLHHAARNAFNNQG